MTESRKSRLELVPQKLPALTKLGDLALWPIMWASCGFQATGFRTGDIQNTHPWHCQRIGDEALKSLDREQFLRVEAPEEKTMLRIPPFFHLPIFGGWRDYVVVTANIKLDANTPKYFVGWAIPEHHQSSKTEVVYRTAELNKLPLRGSVKMLRAGGPPWVDLFAVNADGQQLPLTLVDQGRLGDGRYQDLSLV